MSINTPTHPPITTYGETVDETEDFTYLGSMVSSDGGVAKDIQAGINKARTAFQKLRPVWRSSIFSLRTKIHRYSSNVKSVLLYGSECWRTTKEEMNKLSTFNNRCLRQICRVFWPRKISNEALRDRTRTDDLANEIRRRRLRWLGHVFRMDPGSIPKTALYWTPQGRRNRDAQRQPGGGQ